MLVPSDPVGRMMESIIGRVDAVAFDRSQAEEAVRLLLEGQSGHWPLTTLAEIARPPVWVSGVEEIFPFLGAKDYLAAFAHVRRKRGKANVCPAGNNVWVDIDPPRGLDLREQQKFVSDKLEAVERLVARPSLVVDSGRGAWAWFKLNAPLPQAEVERLNKLLALISGSEDTSCSNADRYSRLPGSRNEKTGRVARVVSLDGTKVRSPGIHNPD